MVMAPGIDGLEICREILKFGAWPEGDHQQNFSEADLGLLCASHYFPDPTCMNLKAVFIIHVYRA